jgi:hypothetical protein
MEIVGNKEVIDGLSKFREKKDDIGIVQKDAIIEALQLLCQLERVESARPGNDGAVGNTIEELLGIPENNLPIPNAAEWELKGQRLGSTSLLTLFHLDPSPRNAYLVTRLLLPKYGWKHRNAGTRYPESEMSFRQTIRGGQRTDRGFGIQVDYQNRRVMVSFDAERVELRHYEWKKEVLQRIGLEELNPQPYWGFDDLYCKAGTKLHNCFFVLAESKTIDKKEFFVFKEVLMLERLSLEKFIAGINEGMVYIDFDARTGHNHGTKFRIRRANLPKLYEKITKIA